MNDNEYRELEKKVLIERYERFKSGKDKAIPFEEVIRKLKAKYFK